MSLQIALGGVVRTRFLNSASAVAKLQHRFALNDEVFRVLFTHAPEPKPAK